MSICSVGAPTLDHTFYSVNQRTAKDGKTAGCFTTTLGGAAVNVHTQVGALSESASAAMWLGKDRIANQIAEELAELLPDACCVRGVLESSRMSVIHAGRVLTNRPKFAVKLADWLGPNVLERLRSASDLVVAPESPANLAETKFLLQIAGPLKVLQLSREQCATASLLAELAPLADLLALNDAELKAATGTSDLIVGIQRLRDIGFRNMIVTHRQGVLSFLDGNWYAQPSFDGDVVRTVGAGDCFLATYLVFRGEDCDHPDALRLAMAAAALYVEGTGNHFDRASIIEASQTRSERRFLRDRTPILARVPIRATLTGAVIATLLLAVSAFI